MMFRIGEVVHLKSGGPDMTVEGVHFGDQFTDPYADCRWFDGDKDKKDRFHLDVLVVSEAA